MRPEPPGFECRRDQKLEEFGLSAEEFIRIKEEFSETEEREWYSDHVCYGSLAYCCLRTSGCRLRDAVPQGQQTAEAK